MREDDGLGCLRGIAYAIVPAMLLWGGLLWAMGEL